MNGILKVLLQDSDAHNASVWVYHASNPEIVMSYYGHLQTTSCGLFTAHEKYLISRSDDTTVKVWDLKNQVLLDTLKGKKFHQAPISSIAVAKKKNIVVTGSIESELAIANYENGNVNNYLNLTNTFRYYTLL